MRIYKYPLKIEDQQTIELPVGAQPLCVQVQFSDPCLWALVDPESPTETKLVRCFGTGHKASAASLMKYIGTVQLDGGHLIFHFFME